MRAVTDSRRAMEPEEPAEPGAQAARVTDLLAYRQSLKRYFSRSLSGDEAEDFVQEVYSRALSAALETKIHNPGGFLRRVASNLLTERFRRRNAQSRRGVHVSIDDASELASPPSDSPERIVAGREALRQLEHALLSMSPVRRRVFTLVRFEGRSYRDVAEAMEMSESAVWKHIDAALAILAKAGIEP